MYPDDLVPEILVRLPVKSLLRFKSVSKSWFSLISSPHFNKSHLLLAIEKPDQTLVVHEDKEGDTLIALLDLNSREVVADLNFPYSKGEVPSLRSSCVVGSACGIVCVCVDMQSRYSYVHGFKFAHHKLNIYLWNPATKQSKLIPPYSIVHDDIEKVSIGFGYDPIGEDFKVVRVLSASAESAKIYSTNRNAWRKVDPNPIDIPSCKIFDCCINGYVCSTGTRGMMAFDLNKEVLNCGITLPITSYLEARITDYDDRIAVIVWWDKAENDTGTEMEESCIVKLWALDDEACLCDSGVKASWTLKLSVDIDMILFSVYGYFNGDLLLMDEDSCAWYNCERKEKKYFPDIYDISEIVKYTESLLSIEGSKQVSWDGHWKEDQVENSIEGEYESEEYEDEYGIAVEDEDED